MWLLWKTHLKALVNSRVVRKGPEMEILELCSKAKRRLTKGLISCYVLRQVCDDHHHSCDLRLLLRICV